VALRLAVPVETRAYELTGLPAPAAERYTLDEAEGVQGAPARLIKSMRTRYWDDALSAPLPAGQAGSRALPHQTYRIAFTEELVTEAYTGRVTPEMLTEGGYVFEAGAWWIPSGVLLYDPAAFYLPVKLTSPFGNESTVEYDSYQVLPTTSRASLLAPLDKLVALARNDYRVLAPVEVTDPNGNGSRTAFDPLGRVIATWVRGKAGAADGDPDDLPGAEYVYGSNAWHDGLGPVWAQSRIRERHGSADGPWQVAKTYSDGTGRVVMTKTQAEPDENATARWVGSGRTVYDNKGKPVKQYEPYFSTTGDYEDEPQIVQQGVTPILHYDPIGRLIRTDHPDGTLSRVVIGPWQQESWDPNDTVQESLWYAERGSPDPDGPEPVNDPPRRAAWLAAGHAATPALSRSDSLGRTVRAIADAGALGMFETVTELDIERNVLSVTDPRGIVVLTQLSDLAGRAVVAKSPDVGDRWTLPDIAGTPCRSWDGISAFHYSFDILRRPLETVVAPEKAPAQTRVVTATWYGEEHPNALDHNLLGRMMITLDQAGMAVAVEHDFKGNLRTGQRRLLADSLTPPDWVGLDAVSVQDVENTVSVKLDSDVHQTATDFDALNRPTATGLPDGTVTTLSYNEAARLESVKVNPTGQLTEDFYVRELDYDAKGQRQFIVYGNFVRTRYSYDTLTYRLTRLETVRDGAPDQPLQDLRYTYDPVGNIVEIHDAAQQSHFYAGQLTRPVARYAYDPLYRLTSATGREHDSLGDQPDNGEPAFGAPIPHPNDAVKLRPYTQTYEYDSSGNITRMRHIAGPTGSWTRDYTYADDSNRLASHTWPQPTPADFVHDVHGNMTTMPHLGALVWDYADRLATVDLLGGGTGRYGYDGSGRRVRKTLQRNGGLVEERIYLGPYEIHRRILNGAEVFRRTTVHVLDDAQRIALIEHKTADGGPVDEIRVRYQLSNHLGSSLLEVDNSVTAQVISYEEYHPFGTTALWLGDGGIEVSDRRYRYTGKEKDEETGLYYHGARYYAPWLARWTAADPIGIKDGTNRYSYVRSNPVRLHDPTGTENKPANATDRKIMEMTDPELYRFLKAQSAEERHVTATTATAAFQNRAWAMIRRYKMETKFTLPEVVITEKAPVAKEAEKASEPSTPAPHEKGWQLTGGYGFFGLIGEHHEAEAGGEALGLIGYDKEKGWYVADLTGVGGKRFVGADERLYYFAGKDKGQHERERLVLAEHEFSRKGLVQPGVGVFVNADDPKEIGVFGFGSAGPVTGGAGVTFELDKDYTAEMKENLAKQGIQLVQLPPGVEPPRQPGWLEGTIASGAKLLGLEGKLEKWAERQVKEQNEYFEKSGSPVRIVRDPPHR
jgi:RHS repeat-associated protein